jgi:hypothetical protein
LAPTTVHYRIKDWKRLKQTIESQPDVEGDPEEGWARLDDSRKEATRVLHSLRRTKKDRIELFAPTRTRAQEGERWLDKIAGDSVEKLVSEVTDPTHLWKKRQERGVKKERDDDLANLPAEEKTRLFEQIYRSIYATWVEDPIPALGGKPPCEAIGTEKGKREVIELLRGYETEERKKAEQEGRGPVSFEFLWEQLGLRRDQFFP